jgi:hypothetical protein
VHSEHLQNVRLFWVALGWVIAAGATSLVFLALVSFGLARAEEGGGFAALATVALGFWSGGLFTGFWARSAPILHGILIGVASLVVWFLLNLLIGLSFGSTGWTALTPTLTAALLLVQILAAIAGAWMGYALALRRTAAAG